MKRFVPLFAAVLLISVPAAAQQDAAQVGARLLQVAAVKAAIDSVRASEPQTLEDQIRLCEVEAPPFKEAKRAVRRGEPDGREIAIGRGLTVPLGVLKQHALRTAPGQTIAYVVDAAYHERNVERIVALARGADQLFIEAMFLEKDRALATATRHLTARDAGALARVAHVKHFIVFHHSARYLSDPSSIGREVRDGFEATRT